MGAIISVFQGDEFFLLRGVLVVAWVDGLRVEFVAAPEVHHGTWHLLRDGRPVGTFTSRQEALDFIAAL